MSYKKPPEPEDDEDFLTKISVKLPSVGGVVSMGDVYNKKKKKNLHSEFSLTNDQ